MYEVFTYGGGEFLRHIFNGIAMVFGDGDYLLLLRTVTIIGVVVTLFTSLLKGGLPDLKGFILVIFVLLGLFVPKVGVVITDRIIPANSSVVANVPFGPAVAIGLFSLTSDYLTRSFETVFSLPSDLKYSGNGLLFANNLVEKSTQFELTDPRIANNFRDYWKACVFYDLALKLYTWEDLSTTNDVMGFLRTHTSQSRYFTYTNTLNADTIINCRTGLSGQMTTDLDDAVTAVSRNQAIRLFPSITDVNNAVSKFAGAMPIAVQHLTGLSRTASEIIQQNVMTNSFKDGLSSFASEVGAEAAIQRYSLARAEAERQATFTTMGEMAKRKLPEMQHMLEAFIYAVSPIIMVLMMIPMLVGKVAMGYVKALLWINLWPPLYAVLHFGMTFYSAAAAKAAITVASSTTAIQSLSMYTNTALGGELSNYSALAGYLSISIPMIAWMLVSGSGAVMASLSNRLLSSYEAPVASATGEASAGNFNLGNLQMENAQFAQQNMAPSSASGGVSLSDGAGNTTRFGSGGNVTSDTAESKGPLSINLSNAMTNAASGNLAEAQSVTESTRADLSSANSTLAQNLSATAHVLSSSTSTASSESVAAQETYKTAEQAVQSMNEEWAEKNNVIDGNQIGLGIKVGLAAGGSGIGVSGGFDYLTQEQQSSLEKFQSSEQYTSALEHQETALKNWTSVEQDAVSDSLKNDFQAASSNQSAASLAHQSAVQNQITASKVLSETQSEQFSSSQNKLDDFYGYLGSQGIDMGEAQTLVRDANSGDPYANRQLNNHINDYTNVEIENMSGGLSQGKLDSNNPGNINESISNLGEAGQETIIQDAQKYNSVVDGRDDQNQSRVALNTRVSEESVASGQGSVSKTIEGGELPNGGLISLDNFNQSEQVLKNKVDGQVESSNIERAGTDAKRTAEEIADSILPMLENFRDQMSPSKNKGS
jgi:conjugal transfer mating pair stabilization protein TraG